MDVILMRPLIDTFSSYNCSLDDANYIYQFVRYVIENFDGNREKFYPLFYNCVSGDEIVFKNLNRRCSVILGFEVANSFLAHISVTIAPESMQSENSNFIEKERNIIKYIVDM